MTDMKYQEASVVFRLPDGSKRLRGLPPGTVLPAVAERLGAESYHLLGLVSGGPGAKVTDVDYGPDGVVVGTATHLLAAA